MTDWLAEYPFDEHFVPHLAALLFAYVLALPIAWDRTRNDRSVGLRTFPLVSISACGFIQAAETVTRENAEATARIVEGLINGIGFIGGGRSSSARRAFVARQPPPAFWATGAIGAAVGLGAYETAIVLSIATFATLRFMTSFKSEENEPRASTSEEKTYEGEKR